MYPHPGIKCAELSKSFERAMKREKKRELYLNVGAGVKGLPRAQAFLYRNRQK